VWPALADPVSEIPAAMARRRPQPQATERRKKLGWDRLGRHL